MLSWIIIITFAVIISIIVNSGFCWWTVSTDFWVKNPGGCTKSRFAEDLRTGKLDGEACVLQFVYFFICLLFVYYLYVCLLFTYFYRAVCWVMHQLRCLALLEGGIGGGSFLWSYVVILVG